MLKEFKKFALKGNVIDLAVGIIIGGAFGKIVSSLVNDIIMPIIGLLIGRINFTNLKYVIKEANGDAAALSINYGIFLQNLIFIFIGRYFSWKNGNIYSYESKKIKLL